jgi:hypothetical protein
MGAHGPQRAQRKNPKNKVVQPFNRVVKPMFWMYNWSLHPKHGCLDRLHCLNGVSEWCSSKSVTFERKKKKTHYTEWSTSPGWAYQRKKGMLLKHTCVLLLRFWGFNKWLWGCRWIDLAESVPNIPQDVKYNCEQFCLLCLYHHRPGWNAAYQPNHPGEMTTMHNGPKIHVHMFSHVFACVRMCSDVFACFRRFSHVFAGFRMC